MKKTQTQKYIEAAVNEAKKELSGNSISNCHIQMHMQADGATQELAKALTAQAEANEANSLAIMKLSESLKPIDVCAIKMGTTEPSSFGAVAD